MNFLDELYELHVWTRRDQMSAGWTVRFSYLPSRLQVVFNTTKRELSARHGPLPFLGRKRAARCG